ncbi:reverse transcriptase domain-containing protein [Paenibacillus sp. FSL M7-1455]|uniref:reverse transcriptase/maturase family protein n=1 Tax=Paenibacillus TaxID=44249 RepID=UPI0020425A8C|nr:reverse transcriptase/maturase family protein [Paenibacillus lactis]MCM3494611.1 reverse transcriptase domain-containing protein [Paenibacillus lactis]
MRSPNRVLESLRSKACISDYRYERLYRNLYNPEFYLQAYQNIYATAGNMTKGTDGSTIDGMSLKRIDKLIASLKNYSYQPNPARRTYIPKNSDPTKKRPLGIPSFDDKLLQEVIRMILESIYEGTFSPHSHGFRPKRSCHTALLEVKTRFTGVKWFVEGDIRGCFDNIDHHVLVSLLRRRIKDEHFLGLIWKFLKAGYMENWIYHNTLSGTPQGSGASPILANIYLNELDQFMEQYAGRFNSGKKRVRSCEYNHYRGHLDYLRGRKYSKKKWEALTDEQKKQAQRELRETRAKMMSVDSTNQMDESYRRVVYIRYADDFLIGVIGSKRDAETIKTEVGAFLKDSLKLDLSAEKTLVTNAKDKARFLSFDIYSNRSKDIKTDKNGMTRRVYNERIKLYVPKEKWVNKLISYGALKIHYDARNGNREVWEPFHRTHLFHNDDLEILQQYNAEIRGLYNYYKIADNVSVLSNFGYIMKYSMFKTFAAKYKTRVGAIKDKYRMGKDYGVKYETKSGSKVMLLYNEGFRRIDEADAGNVDVEPKVYANSSPNSLIARLKAKKCEWCGAENVDMDIHHVRKLKDLKGRKKWEKTMIARRRKTMALCEHCHVQLHAGNLD